MDEKVIVASNGITEKYYYNNEFKDIPKEVQNQLILESTQFTDKNSGIFIIGFKDEGEVYLKSISEESDYNFDEIGSQLDIKELKKSKKELWNSLKLWYNLIYREKNKL